MKNLNLAFDLLVQAAINNQRCPMSSGPSQVEAFSRGEISALCRAGRIRSEVYRHNYRVVVILQGPHRGKNTALPADKKLKPWKIVGTEVTRRDTKAQGRRDQAFPMPKYKFLEKPDA